MARDLAELGTPSMSSWGGGSAAGLHRRVAPKSFCRTRVKEVAATHLGGQIGFTAVLHTWTQKLEYHPHIHCIVPGGALQPGDRWQPTRERYFLPVLGLLVVEAVLVPRKRA